MNASRPALTLLFLLQAGAALQAQELSPRLGFTAFYTNPTDTAGKLYGAGWKVNLTIHVHRESPVEGRVRLEVGQFSEGKDVLTPYFGERSNAQTRLIGYDWLIPLGRKQETPVDLILGIGGAHWYHRTTSFTLPGNAYPYTYSSSGQELAFAATVGFRFRLTRHVELEVHQVLTSFPEHDRDFVDGELSHTAIGVGCRF